MTDERLRKPRVRWGFLVAFALALLMAAHALWAYVETRRLRTTIASMPHAEQTQARASRERDRGDAVRFYRAAAALAPELNFTEDAIVKAAFAIPADSAWTPEMHTQLSRLLESRHDTFAFIDRAAPLPFEGFPTADRRLNRWPEEQTTLMTLCGLRARVRAREGRTVDAVDALLCEARLATPVEDHALRTFGPYRTLQDVQEVLATSKPTSPDLHKLLEPLAGLDGPPDRLRRWLILLRGYLTGPLGAPWSWLDSGVMRPLHTRQLVAQIQMFNRFVAAADGRWPQQLDALAEVSASARNVGFASVGPGTAEQVARPIADSRAVRTAVAIEAYRRDHADEIPAALDVLVPSYLPSLPIDPFSGSPFKLKPEAKGYTVYSIGRNRRDDGGQVKALDPASSKASWPAMLDIGVTIQN